MPVRIMLSEVGGSRGRQLEAQGGGCTDAMMRCGVGPPVVASKPWQRTSYWRRTPTSRYRA